MSSGWSMISVMGYVRVVSEASVPISLIFAGSFRPGNASYSIRHSFTYGALEIRLSGMSMVNSIFEMHLPILSVEALHDAVVHTDAEPDQKANEPE